MGFDSCRVSCAFSEIAFRSSNNVNSRSGYLRCVRLFAHCAYKSTSRWSRLFGQCYVRITVLFTIYLNSFYKKIILFIIEAHNIHNNILFVNIKLYNISCHNIYYKIKLINLCYNNIVLIGSIGKSITELNTNLRVGYRSQEAN